MTTPHKSTVPKTDADAAPRRFRLKLIGVGIGLGNGGFVRCSHGVLRLT